MHRICIIPITIHGTDIIRRKIISPAFCTHRRHSVHSLYVCVLVLLPFSLSLTHSLTLTLTHTFTLFLARSLPKPLECSCSLEHIVCLTHSSASSLFDALICVAAHIYGSLSLLLCFSLFLARFLLVVSVSNWSIFLA